MTAHKYGPLLAVSILPLSDKDLEVNRSAQATYTIAKVRGHQHILGDGRKALEGSDGSQTDHEVDFLVIFRLFGRHHQKHRRAH